MSSVTHTGRVVLVTIRNPNNSRSIKKMPAGRIGKNGPGSGMHGRTWTVHISGTGLSRDHSLKPAQEVRNQIHTSIKAARKATKASTKEGAKEGKASRRTVPAHRWDSPPSHHLRQSFHHGHRSKVWRPIWCLQLLLPLLPLWWLRPTRPLLKKGK